MPPPKTVEELRSRYLSGERVFDGMRLPGSDLSAIDLSGATLVRAILEGSNLEGAILREVHLEGSNLQQVDLRGARLEGANLQQVHLQDSNLKDVHLRGAYLQGAHLERANLKSAKLWAAHLEGAHLEGADIEGAFLRGAYLQGAYLEGASLEDVNLQGANLTGANLRDAYLTDVNLQHANLTGANLQSAKIARADLSWARLEGSTWTKVAIGHTHLVAINLTPLCDVLPTIRFDGPCTVDYESILLSILSPNLKNFLRKAGMPAVFIEYMYSCAESLTTDVFRMLQSTFISFGSPDEPFARKLYEELHKSGVTTFFFPEHAIPGDKLHRMMRKGVNEHDRVILICSKASLDRKGVMNEIEETLAREARAGGAAYLIPLRLDSYIFSGWNPPPEKADVAQAVRDRVVADFEGADKDQAKFDDSFMKLIRALKK
jgi:uncharacterized protein YjbI with pentapeptide repeats